MKTACLSFFFILILAIVGCKKEPGIVSTVRDLGFSSSVNKTIKSNNYFAFNLLKKVNYNLNADSNFLFPTLPVSIGLGMLYNGASGKTATQINQVWNVNSQSASDINMSFKTIKNAFTILDSKVSIYLANSNWFKDSVIQSFIDVTQNDYFADSKKVAFSNGLVGTLNQWIGENTNYNIKTLVDTVSRYNSLLQIDAMYFKGAWSTAFNSFFTSNQVFILRNGDSLKANGGVPTMVQKQPYLYYIDDWMEVTEVPFGYDGNYNMVFLLPKIGKSVDDIINQLDDTYWNSIVSAYKVNTNLQIYIPKFKLVTTYTLKDILSQMGLDSLFSPTDANFTTLNATAKIYLSNVIQKIQFQIGETGIANAGVVIQNISASSAAGSMYQYYPLQLNRPFLFMLREKYSNTIILIGKLNNPAQCPNNDKL